MNCKEADLIIKDYKPYKGFYDLSTKPKSLTKIEYAKVLKIQEFLAKQARNKEYLRQFTPIQYEKTKELTANYQSIIWEHWEF